MTDFRTRSTLLSVTEFAAGLISTYRKPPDTEILLATAAYVAKLPGLCCGEIDLALNVLLRALGEEAGLSRFGSLVAHWDIKNRLANLCRFHERERRFPRVVEEPIVAPIIITGSPRSGTTFLQTLLAEIPENDVPRCWEVVYPHLAPHESRWRDFRPLRMERQLRYFKRLAPDLHKVHPISAWSPQECTEIQAHVFQSLRFSSTYNIPSYRKWLDDHGYRAAYGFHKRFLQHLQHQHGRQQWILKSPDHVFALDAMLSTYPDARVVFVHRDPIKVLPSNAHLIEIIRAPFTTRIDRWEIGRQLTADLASGAANMIEAARTGRIPSSRLFHLYFSDLVSRPLDSILRLYRHFGLSITASAAERISRRIAVQPTGGYARNAYRFERHNINPDEVEARFRDYVTYFDVPREPIGPTLSRTSKFAPISTTHAEYLPR